MSSAALGRFAHTPLVITTGSNDVIVERVGGVDRNATIAAGTYYVRGDGASDDLLAAVKTALDATASGVTYTLTIASHTGSTRGFVTVAGDGTFILRGSASGTTFNRLYLGIQSGDTASGTSVTSAIVPLQLWYPTVEGLLYDNDEQSERRRNGALSGYMHTSTLTTYDVQRVVFEFVDRANVKNTYASATHFPFQAMWGQLAAGGRFLFWPDNDDAGTVAEWVIDDDRWCERLSNAAEVMAPGERYRITIPMREYVASS